MIILIIQRIVTLGSILGKLFDSVVFTPNQEILKSSHPQYGFKSEHSSSMCSFAAKIVLYYYVIKNQGLHGMYAAQRDYLALIGYNMKVYKP